ncbi:class I SAM-dependent methyltransferase [Pseudenhygromyxa sp. WMMC2535]|uniref:class I SAM-dependent methyltransferase n=1 Tax=Pseudenhygromyxa sp. WMMC2535 TaxID=2712867 RepID=UPI0015516520|nr:class I SAM-dependent methyltransferase [Pseudenhygromyxa sp. WMMC2535]NVB38342.1 class I SAM-dependent methyltransferase [Pseudenhygromyxa sp. WMMC2535]
MTTNKVEVALGPVQETLLIPLLGRAEETRKKRGLVHDPKAVEIVDSLDYDFGRWKGIRSLVGASIRTRLFDDEVRAFLDKHPEGTIIEIGAGLNTRYERLDNGRARWLELDLPDSMALRRRFFADTERRTMIDASALETDWYDRVEALPGPYCFVSEAVIIYIDNDAVEAMLRQLAARFPGAVLVTDTTCSKMVDDQAKHDAMSKMPKDAWFRWRCDDPGGLEHLDLHLERSRSFADAPAEVVAAMPLLYRLIFTAAPWIMRRQADGYRINRFRLGS